MSTWRLALRPEGVRVGFPSAPSRSTVDGSKSDMNEVPPPGLEQSETLSSDTASRGDDRRWLWFVSYCAALPVALFLALQPERYSLTPNSLDPVFYTGYASNFDDVLNAAGDRHYFVTRWTAYYPVYLL